MKRRIMSILLSAVLLLTGLPISGSAPLENGTRQPEKQQEDSPGSLNEHILSLSVEDKWIPEDSISESGDDKINLRYAVYGVNPDSITVETDQGTFTGEPFEVIEEIQNAFGEPCWWDCINDQTQENLWSVGEHTATFALEGLSADYTVHITEGPIESISIDPVKKMEGDTENDWYQLYDEETGEYGEDVIWQKYNVYPGSMTAVMRDGRVLSGDIWSLRDQISEEYNTYIGYIDLSDQWYKNQWAAGDHTAKLQFGHLIAEYPVHILENPVKSVTAEDKDLLDSEGYEISEWIYNQETEEYEEKVYYYYPSEPNAVTVVTEGGSYTGTVWEVTEALSEAYGISIPCSIEDGQSWDHPWGLGEHSCSISFGDVSGEYRVTIHKMEDLTRDLVLDREETVEAAPEAPYAYFRFVPEESGAYLFYSAGPAADGYAAVDAYDAEGNSLMSDSAFGYENGFILALDLTAGEECFFRTEAVPREEALNYTVRIVKSPVLSVSAGDCSLYTSDAYELEEFCWDPEIEDYVVQHWMKYDPRPKEISIVTNFGEMSGSPDEINDWFSERYQLPFNWMIRDDQSYQNPWTVGEHSAVFDIYGAKAGFKVTIQDSPLKSLQVDPISCYEWEKVILQENVFVDNEWVLVDYEGYAAEPKMIYVTTADGVISGAPYDVAEQLAERYGITNPYGYVETDQTSDNSWGVGEHDAVYHIAGLSAEYKVTILPTPIKSIKAEPLTYYEGFGIITAERAGDGSIDFWIYYDVIPTKLTVETEDGVYSGSFGEIQSKLREKYQIYYDYRFEMEEQSYQTPWSVGEHPCTLIYAGKRIPYTITILESPVLSVKADDVSRYQNAGSTARYEGDEWIYYESMPNHIIVTTAEREIQGTPAEVNTRLGNIYGFRPQYTSLDDQSYYSQWLPGNTYDAVFIIGGKKASYKVKILNEELEIRNILVEDTVNYEGNTYPRTDASGREYPHYDINVHNITIVTNQGELSGKIDDVINEFNDRFGVSLYWGTESDQSADNVWGLGDHSAFFTARFPGKENEKYPFKVTIKETPILKIEVSDINHYLSDYRTENGYTDPDTGYWIPAEWHSYYSVPHAVTIYTDKKIYSGTLGMVTGGVFAMMYEDYGVYFSSELEEEDPQAYGHEWGVGAHKATLRVSGVKADYYVNILNKVSDTSNYVLDKHELTVKFGDTAKLTVTDTATGEEPIDLQWWDSWYPASNQYSVVHVTQNGTVTTANVGKAMVHVWNGNTSFYETCEIQVLFKDVANSKKYYYDAVYWVLDRGITTGMKDADGNPSGEFEPEKNCTRGDVVTFLWRLSGSPEPKTEIEFTDVKKNKYFYKAVAWAAENGITTGTKDDQGNPTGKFEPGKTCTRAEVVTFLYRAAGEPAVSGTNEFTDCKKGKFYYNAVTWAANQGITTGVSKTTFGVNNTCTRGQIATFLARYGESIEMY